MKNLYSLFLSQAYQDCWDDYNRSLRLRNFPKWDYVILTASNEQQAEGFRKQIEERKDFLPKETTFVAIPNSVRCFIPQIIGTRKGNASQTALSYKFIIQQIKTIRYRNIANGIFISQQCFKISQGSRNFVPFGNNIQIIITRSQIYPPQHCHYHK